MELFYQFMMNLPLGKSRILIKHILVRHEQSAAHAADAYLNNKKVGVFFATSGPGATNLVTGIANAKMDSIPIIIITGQVTRSFIELMLFKKLIFLELLYQLLNILIQFEILKIT